MLLHFRLDSGLLSSAVVVVVAIVSVLLFSYLLGLDRSERGMINGKLSNLFAGLKLKEEA